MTFYQEDGYLLFPSASLIDESIPMSFVMSAGFPQVEAHIREYLNAHLDNIALVQNCFRHFDMKRVGESPTHLSLFRMLGAFHFGKVEPVEQIRRVWHLLSNEYALPPKRVWVTYFTGGEIDGFYFEEDDRVFKAWQLTEVPLEHIVGHGDKQNFWRQSAVGLSEENPAKCGITTEIFYDRGEGLACGPNCQPGCPCGRFVEIVNILFVQWKITGEGLRSPLRVPFTEIVLGSERMAMVQQETDTIFYIKTIHPLVSKIEQYVRVQGDGMKKYVFVIADHLRALAFLCADGAPPPGKGGRAFIVRKLMREMFTAMKILKIQEDTFFPDVLDILTQTHLLLQPKLRDIQDVLLKSLDDESARFEKTLQRGRERLARLLPRLGDVPFPEDEVTRFEKSFGVPRPLLLKMLEEKGVARANLPVSYFHQENMV